MVRRPPLMSTAAGWCLLRRPRLWPTAAVVGAAMVDPRWWRRIPPVPRPPAGYQAMRHQTMFGTDPTARLVPDELVGYLEWCACMRRSAR